MAVAHCSHRAASARAFQIAAQRHAARHWTTGVVARVLASAEMGDSVVSKIWNARLIRCASMPREVSSEGAPRTQFAGRSLAARLQPNLATAVRPAQNAAAHARCA